METPKRPRGRPRLSDEEKARRAAERKQRKQEPASRADAWRAYALETLHQQFFAMCDRQGFRLALPQDLWDPHLPSRALLEKILGKDGPKETKAWIDTIWLPLIGSKLIDGCSLAPGDTIWVVPALRKSTDSVAKFERWSYENLPELERILIEQDAKKQDQASKRRSLREEPPDPLEDDPLDPESWPALIACAGVTRETDGKEITHLTCRARYGMYRPHDPAAEFLSARQNQLEEDDAQEKEIAVRGAPPEDRSWVARRPFLMKKIVIQLEESLFALRYELLPPAERAELEAELSKTMTKKQVARFMKKRIRPDKEIFPKHLLSLDKYEATGRPRSRREEQRLAKEQVTKLGHTTIPGNVPLDTSPECMAYPFGERLRAFVHREDLKPYLTTKFKVKFKGGREGDPDATYLKAYRTAKTAMSVLTPWGKVHINQLLVSYVTGKYYDRVAPPKEVSFGWLKENLLWEEPAIPSCGSGTLILLKRIG